MLYFALKVAHILAAVLFLGTGLGSAWYKWRADRSGDVRVIVWAAREIVLADWLFTVPAGVLLPLSGLWLAVRGGHDWTSGWVLWGLCGYAVAGVTWLPAAWLQLRMRALADTALRERPEIPPLFHRYARIWAALGVPSFGAAILTVWVMTARYAAFG